MQAALAKAIHSWAQNGVPNDPAGWLYRTARNLAIDTIRRSQVEHRIFAESSLEQAFLAEDESVAYSAEVEDSSLRFLFLCCHPADCDHGGTARLPKRSIVLEKPLKRPHTGPTHFR